MRIVLDTNCLIQVIPPQSPYHHVWTSFEKGENVLCVSNDILEEYAEIIQRLVDVETAEVVLSTIVNSPFVKLIDPYYQFNLIKADPDDNKFVDCAIAAGARFLVSNDRHYYVLKQITYPKVEVLTLPEFSQLTHNC